MAQGSWLMADGQGGPARPWGPGARPRSGARPGAPPGLGAALALLGQTCPPRHAPNTCCHMHGEATLFNALARLTVLERCYFQMLAPRALCLICHDLDLLRMLVATKLPCVDTPESLRLQQRSSCQDILRQLRLRAPWRASQEWPFLRPRFNAPHPGTSFPVLNPGKHYPQDTPLTTQRIKSAASACKRLVFQPTQYPQRWDVHELLG